MQASGAVCVGDRQSICISVANMISVLWSALLILHAHVCCCIKLIQVKWACCAFVTSPSPPASGSSAPSGEGGSCPEHSLGGSGGCSKNQKGVPSAWMDGKPALQPHWPWAEKVNNCKRADYIWQGICQTEQCGGTFHLVRGQSLLPGPPHVPCNNVFLRISH